MQVAGDPRVMGRRSLWGLGTEAGVGLVEVLMAALLVGLASVGLALMFSTGNAYVVATGDDRIALGLAGQKIEQIRAGSVVVTPGVVGTETVSTGASPQQRTFTRVTCPQYVDSADLSTPAYTAACPAGTAGTPPVTRVTVIVTPKQPQANEVKLQAWLE